MLYIIVLKRLRTALIYPLRDFKAISDHFDADILDAISIEACMAVVITILVLLQKCVERTTEQW